MVCERVMIIEREDKAAPSCVRNHSVNGWNYESVRAMLRVCERESICALAVDENNDQMYVESRHFLLLCSENVLIRPPPHIVVIVGCRTGKQMGASLCYYFKLWNGTSSVSACPGEGQAVWNLENTVKQATFKLLNLVLFLLTCIQVTELFHLPAQLEQCVHQLFLFINKENITNSWQLLFSVQYKFHHSSNLAPLHN